MGERDAFAPARAGRSDVVIVGAGPAGCAAGIVLAKAGVDVCVLDRARFPRNKPCGDAVSNDAMNLLKKLCPPAALDQVPRAIVRRASVLFPDKTHVERAYREPGTIMPRRRLDECLRESLEASGARLVQQCPVTSLSLRGSRTCGVSGPSLRWSSDIVVAAHGCNAKGADDLLGHSARTHPNHAVAMTAYFRNVAFPGDASTSEHHLSEHPAGGYGWVFPPVDGVCNVGFFTHEDALLRCGHSLRELFDTFIASLGDRFRNAERIGGPRTGWLTLAPWSTALARDGLLLCGDAAGMADPLTGEGIWQALWSGIVAGETSLQALRGNGLTSRRQRGYEQKCWRTIGRPSSARRWVHKGLAAAMEHRIYTSEVLQRLLQWGYQRQTFEMSKT